MIINDDFNNYEKYKIPKAPCAGSGATYYVAKKLNRKFYGFEILKEFYDKIKDWEDNYE